MEVDSDGHLMADIRQKQVELRAMVGVDSNS
jgi:hypothetical protein